MRTGSSRNLLTHLSLAPQLLTVPLVYEIGTFLRKWRAQRLQRQSRCGDKRRGPMGSG